MKAVMITLLGMHAALCQAVWFEPNQGQAHPSVKFLARTGGGYAYFGPNRTAVRDVRMQFIGASGEGLLEFEEPTGGITSYFTGRNEKDWHTGIPQYRRVRYKNVYSAIDVVYYLNRSDVEYDFVVRPGGDPKQILLAYNKPVLVDANGDLLIAGLRQKRPKVYQNGREIACEYVVGKRNEVRLALAEYDHSQTLTVDPALDFSTYLGGVAEESGNAIKLDVQGNVYITGASQAPSQPGLNPFQQTTDLILSPVVFKMTPDGQKMIWYAFVGNGGWDQANALDVDANGSAVITGRTRNSNYPLKNAFQTQYLTVYGTAFVTRISPDGRSLIYSSYIGGSTQETAYGLALDTQGNALLTGMTASNDFPVKQAFQSRYAGGSDCYAAKVDANGNLLWSTYIGGGAGDFCYGIAADKQGNGYIAGASRSLDFPLKNAFQTTMTPRGGFFTPILIKMTPDGSLALATFVGGPVAGAAYGGIALDPSGNVYLAGYADGALATKNAFQVQSGSSQNGFLLEIDQTLHNIVFATYLGGSGSDSILGIALDQFGGIYVAGQTSSADFPVKGSFQSFIGGGGACQCDAFVAKFAPGGQSLNYSTLLGGHDLDVADAIAVDSSGNAYVTGVTRSDDFPTKNAYQSRYGGGGDFFFTEISDNTPPSPSPLTPTPGHLTFRYTQGGTAPIPQTVVVSGPAFAAATSVPWLSVSSNGSNVTIAINPAGLAPNTYTGSITLAPQGATPASISVTLTILAPAPVVTSVDPALVPMGSNDTTITVHGNGFTSSSVLQVNGIPWTVTPVQFIDSSTLKFSMPASYFTVQYNHTIAVQNPQSALSNVLSVAVGQPAPVAVSVANAASYATGAVAPGEIVAIFGSNFGTQNDTTVSFDNIPATLLYVTATQLAATVPYAVAGLQKTSMTITSKGVNSVPVSLSVTGAVPAIFTADATGKGQAAALNQDSTVNGTSNPAAVGSVVALYGTGGGTLTADALPRLNLPVSATVGGLPAIIYYAGVAPGLVQGAMQVNLQIPGGVTPGSAVPVVVTIGAAATDFVTLAIH